MKANLSSAKSHFFKEGTHLPGISMEGIGTDPEKVAAELEPPSIAKELRQ